MPAVMVPGAAGSAGIGAIRSLRELGYSGRIIATDGEPLAAGFPLSDSCFVTHNLDNPQEFRRLRAIVEKENIQLILPTSAEDVKVFSRYKEQLMESGVRFAGCDAPVVQLCDDKLNFWQAIHDSFPVPANISVEGGHPSTYPCFLKPRIGSGGRNTSICRNADEWRFFRSRCDSLIAQELLPGAEYSVDVLSDLDGLPLVAIPRERLAITDGVTTRARVVRDEGLEELCLRLAQFLCVKGVACMQLKRDVEGHLKFLEVNTRLGGSARISSTAGVDLVGCLVALATGRELPSLRYREITVVRYFDEVVIESQ